MQGTNDCFSKWIPLWKCKTVNRHFFGKLKLVVKRKVFFIIELNQNWKRISEYLGTEELDARNKIELYQLNLLSKYETFHLDNSELTLVYSNSGIRVQIPSFNGKNKKLEFFELPRFQCRDQNRHFLIGYSSKKVKFSMETVDGRFQACRYWEECVSSWR